MPTQRAELNAMRREPTNPSRDPQRYLTAVGTSQWIGRRTYAPMGVRHAVVGAMGAAITLWRWD